MDIGIGLPATIPGVTTNQVLQWAENAEKGPFSSVSALDRLVYPNLDPLITLAAVATVTQRVRLLTSVLVAPLRRPGVLAKQALTLDSFSNGRLSLGLGVGGRKDDFLAAPATFESRGRDMDRLMRVFESTWKGQSIEEGVNPIGPRPIQPEGPELLIGGFSDAAINRVGRWANGYLGTGPNCDLVASFYKKSQESWEKSGRSGRPRLVGAVYYVLGAENVERGAAYITDYYGFMGEAVKNRVQDMVTTPDRVKELIIKFTEIGMDELHFWPCVPDLDQISRLEESIK